MSFLPDIAQWTSNTRMDVLSIIPCALVLAWLERAAGGGAGARLRADPWCYAQIALAERKLRRRRRRALARR
jgi:hypothetical protein